MNVTNEMGTVIQLVRKLRDTKWTIISAGAAFPDLTLRHRNGQIITCEVEYKASNFIDHGHDPTACDLIACWINDMPDCPMDIWELSKPCEFRAPENDPRDFAIWVLKKQVNRLRERLESAMDNAPVLEPPDIEQWVSDEISKAKAEKKHASQMKLAQQLLAKKLHEEGLSIAEIARRVLRVKGKPSGLHHKEIKSYLDAT